MKKLLEKSNNGAVDYIKAKNSITFIIFIFNIILIVLYTSYNYFLHFLAEVWLKRVFCS